ncbi:MAG: hypothetical protein A2086_16385 [Spirochaetes bacterium GWD1_27_9]|nr:MAG: hypothetical protein A2Z98_12130 [Spirochaetes bacterium GWB1_27_13]OHD27814.1 MAG: hypothetical protein A2Y34_16630 [Spirochaetes bacterium GWC1_27_15]OHD33010.1 MAG: hypothetical protein A2086_16385 [Spirochaetes bacterium GWD1_27_9]
MESIIQDIINSIENGCIFDSHTVISILIEKYSNEYLNFASQFLNTENITNITHSRISKIIDQFDGTLIIRQQNQSFSKNIHNRYTKCACWIKN